MYQWIIGFLLTRSGTYHTYYVYKSHAEIYQFFVVFKWNMFDKIVYFLSSYRSTTSTIRKKNMVVFEGVEFDCT